MKIGYLSAFISLTTLEPVQLFIVDAEEGHHREGDERDHGDRSDRKDERKASPKP